MGFENAPVAVFIQPLVPRSLAPYFFACVFAVVAACLYHLRYRLYQRAHLMPPPEWFWVRRLFLGRR